MKEKSQSKAAIRTRKWITDALISLMEEKDFSDISITEIVEKADVSRQSFYRHFSTKEEIFDNYFYESIIRKFKDTYVAKPDDTVYTILKFYFNFWYENIEVMNLVIKSNYPMQMFEEYDHLLRVHFADSLAVLEQQINTEKEDEKEILKSFIIGGLYNAKHYWTKTGYKKTPHEMAKIVENMFNKNNEV